MSNEEEEVNLFRRLYGKLAHYHSDAATTINTLGPLFEQIITIKDAEIVDLQKKVSELEKKLKEKNK